MNKGDGGRAKSCAATAGRLMVAGEIDQSCARTGSGASGITCFVFVADIGDKPLLLDRFGQQRALVQN